MQSSSDSKVSAYSITRKESNIIMLKTNQFQVTSKEALCDLASKYQLEFITKEERNKVT